MILCNVVFVGGDINRCGWHGPPISPNLLEHPAVPEDRDLPPALGDHDPDRFRDERDPGNR